MATESRLFDRDEELGVTRVFHYDDNDNEGGFTIETESDVTQIVEENKADFNGTDERANWKKELHRVASIPMGLFLQMKAQGITTDQKAMKKWLNDSDNRFFRTRPGVV